MTRTGIITCHSALSAMPRVCGIDPLTIGTLPIHGRGNQKEAIGKVCSILRAVVNVDTPSTPDLTVLLRVGHHSRIHQSLTDFAKSHGVAEREALYADATIAATVFPLAKRDVPPKTNPETVLLACCDILGVRPSFFVMPDAKDWHKRQQRRSRMRSYVCFALTRICGTSRGQTGVIVGLHHSDVTRHLQRLEDGPIDVADSFMWCVVDRLWDRSRIDDEAVRDRLGTGIVGGEGEALLVQAEEAVKL